MSNKEGQAVTQPSEGVKSLDDIVSLDAGEEGGEEAQDESEGGEESDESEIEESETDESGEDGEQEEATFTIKHDGKDVTLKQSELLDMAQKGFDYTQKTMAVADERKAAETAKAQAGELRQRHEAALNEQVQRLQALEQFFESQVGNPPPIEWAQQDAAYYLAQKELHDTRKGQLEQARAAIQHLQADQHRQRQAWVMEQAEATERALRDTLPGWNDKTLPELAEYAGKFGLSEKVADHVLLQKGFWEIAQKAKAYDELQAKKAEMKPVSQLSKVAKPGTSNQPPQLARRQEAMKRFKAAPSLDGLAALV